MTDPRLFLSVYIFAFIMGVVFGYASRWKEVSDKDNLLEFQAKQWLLTQCSNIKLTAENARLRSPPREKNGRFCK